MRARKYAVQASVSAAGRPQAAVVGIAVSDRFELVFDTVDSTRKALNLRGNGAVAFVIGGTHDDDEQTVQYEGVAYEPSGAERERALDVYLSRFPDGHERLGWAGIRHFLVKPVWIRYSDFSTDPPQIVEFDAHALGRAGEDHS